MTNKKLIEAIKKARREVTIKVHYEDSCGGSNEFERIVYVDPNILIAELED